MRTVAWPELCLLQGQMPRSPGTPTPTVPSTHSAC